jgi:hypothetical protein
MKNSMATLPGEECCVLDNIPFQLDISHIMTRLVFHPEIRLSRANVQGLINQVEMLARPRAVFKSSVVSDRINNSLRIDTMEFRNPLLQVNLKTVNSVFPFVITCGEKFARSTISGGKVDAGYALDVIWEMVLTKVSSYVQNYVAHQFKLDYLWQLNPGSLQAWPVEERQLVFYLLGDVKSLVGVELLDDFTLKPEFSKCGIFYYSDTEFEACQICPQEPCMGRRAPYNEELKRKYSSRARMPCGSRRPELRVSSR